MAKKCNNGPIVVPVTGKGFVIVQLVHFYNVVTI